jgi:coatomer protein complex subunit gamma
MEVGLTAMQKEATEVFFSVTKLFQAKDANLRRMVYLVIKEVRSRMISGKRELANPRVATISTIQSLAGSGILKTTYVAQVGPSSDEVIIIVSSLMKDMNSKVDLYRSNAIRVLCSIADSQVLGNIERYFKQVRCFHRDARIS